MSQTEGSSSAAASTLEIDEKNKVAPTQVDTQAVEAAPKSSWRSWDGIVHWIQDRDYHVWLMSFGFTVLFTSYPIQGVQTIR
jgi:endo-beta-N-acetylglucosaminidase D